MVDDVVPELQCHSLPHGMDEHHSKVAAQNNLYDMVVEGKMWGCDFFVIDADDEVEEGEGGVHLLDDGVYKEENAQWRGG